MANIVYVGPWQDSPEAKVFATTYNPVVFFLVRIYPDSVGINLLDDADIDFKTLCATFSSFMDNDDSNFFDTVEYYFKTECKRQIVTSFNGISISIE